MNPAGVDEFLLVHPRRRSGDVDDIHDDGLMQPSGVIGNGNHVHARRLFDPSGFVHLCGIANVHMHRLVEPSAAHSLQMVEAQLRRQVPPTVVVRCRGARRITRGALDKRTDMTQPYSILTLPRWFPHFEGPESLQE